MKPKMRCVKTSLKSITDRKTAKRINEIVHRCNRIVIVTYQFLKLYVLNTYDRTLTAPLIDVNLILNIMKTVCSNSNKRGRKVTKNKKLMDRLERFYDSNFRQLIDKKENSAHLSHIFIYLANDIVKNIENNIKLHFLKHLKNYLAYLYTFQCNDSPKDQTMKSQTKKDLNKALRMFIKYEKDDNCEINRSTMFIPYIKTTFPEHTEDSFLLDSKINPQRYLSFMIKMCKEIETYNGELVEKDQDRTHKLYSVFPLRSSIIPKYIPIDKTIILDALVGKGLSYLYSGNKTNDVYEVWKLSFKKMFKRGRKSVLRSKNYSFNKLILTDGYAVSILQIRKDLFGKRVRGSKKKKSEKYFDELKRKELRELKEYKIIGVDPGKRNIVSFMDDNKQMLRYTSLQRRFECKIKYNKQQIDTFKKFCINNDESELSNYNSKSCMLNIFTEYVKAKNRINKKLFKKYGVDVFRECKWRKYIYTQKSESKLVNNIKKKYLLNNNEKICLAYGNWSQTKQMRNYFPTPGIGMKRMLSKYFKVITIDEFKTSKLCCACNSETENFMKRSNPKPYKREQTIEVHSLLRCKNVNCNKFWDRDVNGSTNILKLAHNYLENSERLENFRREKRVNKKKNNDLFLKELKESLKEEQLSAYLDE